MTQTEQQRGSIHGAARAKSEAWLIEVERLADELGDDGIRVANRLGYRCFSDMSARLRSLGRCDLQDRLRPAQSPAPRREYTSDYLGRLARLPLPDGWRFWCLAGALGRQVPGCTWAILTRRDEWREACVDVETGAVRQWGERI